MILKIFISRKGYQSVQGELIFSIIFLNFFCTRHLISPSIPLKIYDTGEAFERRMFYGAGGGSELCLIFTTLERKVQQLILNLENNKKCKYCKADYG